MPTAIAEADNTQFQTYTVVCRFDETAVTQLTIDPANAVANVNRPVASARREEIYNLSPYLVYSLSSSPIISCGIAAA